MSAEQRSISWLEFQQRFASEDACRDDLFRVRWPQGFRCPRCHHDKAYPLHARHLYQCAQCRYQASVTAGTLFHKTRVPLRTWFWALYLVARDKRGVSAQMLARELGVSYPTAWLMLHKIRRAMSLRDSRHLLAGIVELDDSDFGAPTHGDKRGRGTERTPVLVALSLSRAGHPLHVKMRVVSDLQASTVRAFVRQAIQPGSRLVSDKHASFMAAGKEGYEQDAVKFDPEKNPDHLHWLHTIVSNAKAFIAGTYHGLGTKHLQWYLDELCYRFNRRRLHAELFHRVVTACVSAPPITYAEVV